MYQNALVIVCDTANAPRIDDQRFNQGKDLIKMIILLINMAELCRYNASSTSEIILILLHILMILILSMNLSHVFYI